MSATDDQANIAYVILTKPTDPPLIFTTELGGRQSNRANRNQRAGSTTMARTRALKC
jgi:hypothetical protein